MSDAAQAGGATGATASTSGTLNRPSIDQGRDPGKGKKPGGPSRGMVIAVIGALITAGIAVSTLAPSLGTRSSTATITEPTLSALPSAEIPAALPTLDPTSSKAAVDDAKACKAPLAWVRLTQRPGGHGGVVRIRSGSYLSPPIQVNSTPQRIAIPFPASYQTGRGVLLLVGDADQVQFDLNPGAFVPNVNGTWSINVWWTVRNPCG